MVKRLSIVGLRDLRDGEVVSQLRSLYVADQPDLRDLTAVADLSDLRSLSLLGLRRFDMQCLVRAERLRVVQIGLVQNLSGMRNVAQLKHLRKLRIDGLRRWDLAAVPDDWAVVDLEIVDQRAASLAMSRELSRRPGWFVAPPVPSAVAVSRRGDSPEWEVEVTDFERFATGPGSTVSADVEKALRPYLHSEFDRASIWFDSESDVVRIVCINEETAVRVKRTVEQAAG
ncbi:hypothetical protein [Curtobacterium sp. RRHDQ10]|uniref:hypothetical protein n=1 Tax=Curtobacterium phyllosphaerae TaxID=3413379 RepID=UPI003BF1C808